MDKITEISTKRETKGKMGKLYLIPAPLGDGEVTDVIPTGVLSTIPTLKHFVVEELRSARRYLSKAGMKGRIDELEFYVLNEHSGREDSEFYIEILLGGNDVGLISEAGLPAVADPGGSLVEIAHRKGITVIPLVGPSSLMLALMASGKNGQSFAFVGYLPVKSDERRAKLKELERLSAVNGQSQIFIETPYRNHSLMSDIIDVCSEKTMVTVAAGLTTADAYIRTLSIKDWRREKFDIDKIPCVFII